MYIDPLAELVAFNGGRVYNMSAYLRLCDAVTLMVDVKQGGGAADPNTSFVVLHSILAEYQGAWVRLRSCSHRNAVPLSSFMQRHAVRFAAQKAQAG